MKRTIPKDANKKNFQEAVRRKTIRHETDLTDSCPDCGDEYVAPGHECGPAEPDKASEIQDTSAEAFLQIALGGNMNVSTLTAFSLAKLMTAYASHLLITIDDQAEQLKAKDELLRRAKDTLEPYPVIGKLKALKEFMRTGKNVTPEDADVMAEALDNLERKYGQLYKDIEQALKGGEK